MDIMILHELEGLFRSIWVVWLMVIFAAVIYWAYRPKNKKRFEDDAKMIFKDEDNGG
ncbi:cbb3-type cytochrome oxidase subunit 3 [Varunaivibrio sulfuroxidans]|uniref:Cytochrome c oxidase cbb3-type subunit 4 n=1 Tax=Varunaivibrio sulfuroxidans TaxID=1773489 RepID=A0A4R3JF28_9PROT|nr:cbb3-type cytochrome c oxidase subunit 3 [Varunaivibrio sulfuroxidans]TCS64085.1 cytochrome c oxidase cbb3-type subunit 4 [Varunaivibrio sulfuroxidans]WES31465.1 cbb3-type cytochrome c oxidase subunit 3 [Varunaivibrio sulfuroxidans]